MPAVVASVRPGSIAARAGLAAGDQVLRVNGRAPRDYIEYRYLTTADTVVLTCRDAQGGSHRVHVEKPIDEDLGFIFTSDVFDGIRTCSNACPLCFVAQLPRGLRPALYVRDDDYRLSFLHGNFVTLTNLTPADRRRIAEMHLSPLYVSVHSTEPEVRRRVFGGPTPNVLQEMRRLAGKGIEFHTQIVVCPGVNDGAHLARTVLDLAALHPGVRSVGVVPVGLTRHRRGRPEVRPVGRRLAGELIGQVQEWQRALRGRLGTGFVFAADELYLHAGLPIPRRARYEGLWQLANGIGGARLFLDGVSRLRPPKLPRRVSAILVTGELAAEMVRDLAARLEQGGSVSMQVCVVRNRLLGRSVTVAGLLAGRDIVRALRSCLRGDLVIVPGTAVREGEGFLDGMRLEEVSRKVKMPVFVAGTPREAAAVISAFARGGNRP
jgi:putative radical SAM enzyme (TIGR03279 family)